MKEFLPLERCTSIYPRSVFLAGSIEGGDAEEWQKQVVGMLKDSNVNVFNPRRVDWDATWVQSIQHPQFKQQVEWELEHIQKADIVFFYFSPTTKAPITLLEFGLIAGQSPKKCIVMCPEGYWKKGNVDIVCQQFDIKQVDTFEQAVKLIRQA